MTEVNVQNNSTYVAAPVSSGSHIQQCEHTMTMDTGLFRAALAFNLMADVVQLKKMFSEVIISDVHAEVRQDALLGQADGFVLPTGRIFVAVIPSGKNTDAQSGSSAAGVLGVRRKQAFPLSVNTQENVAMSFNLVGFETDLAQDPRRQQGPVAWIGNTGIRAYTKGQVFPVCSVTWYFKCTCTGVAAIW